MTDLLGHHIFPACIGAIIWVEADIGVCKRTIAQKIVLFSFQIVLAFDDILDPQINNPILINIFPKMGITFLDFLHYFPNFARFQSVQ